MSVKLNYISTHEAGKQLKVIEEQDGRGALNTTNFISKAVSVSPSDTTDLTDGATKGLYVGGTGDVVVTMANGADITLTGLSAGVVHPLSVTGVKLTGTTATGIVAMY